MRDEEKGAGGGGGEGWKVELKYFKKTIPGSRGKHTGIF